MEIYRNLIQLKLPGAATISMRLSRGIVALIQKGSIQPKDRLPPVRKMAELLKIHPKTVVAAYEDLVSQGWVETIQRKGIYVSSILPVIKPVELTLEKKLSRRNKHVQSAAFIRDGEKNKYTVPPLIIDDGFPDHRLAPLDALLRDYRRLMNMGYAIRSSMYADPAGNGPLRLLLSRCLRETRALPVVQENLCITRGAQMGLYLLCRLLIKKGAKVIVADPNYALANEVLSECGASLIKVPVEKDGIAVEQVRRICARQKIDGIYVIPHHHHPTTACLSPEKRIALLEIVEKHGLFVIEDDYDFDYHYDSNPILPLASYSKGRNIFYIGSISKVISNSLRLGFICCDTRSMEEIIRLRRLVDLRGDSFLELAVANFIKSGDFERHIKRTRKIYEERRDLMHGMLKDKFQDFIVADKPKGGMAIWATFGSRINLPELSRNAAKKGLGISDGSFYNTTVNLNSIRMGFASHSPDEIRKFGQLLGAVLWR